MSAGWLRGLQRLLPGRPKPPAAPPPAELTAGFYAPTGGDLGYRAPPARDQPPVDAETVRATLESRLGPLIESITDLDDEQRARLRGWSNARLAELATTARRHPEREAGSQLERAAGQLVGLLEAISLALSGWDARQPGMALGRLELLDTYLEPPLLVGQRLDVARGRVAVLLEDLRDHIDQVAPKSEIARRLLEALD